MPIIVSHAGVFGRPAPGPEGAEHQGGSLALSVSLAGAGPIANRPAWWSSTAGRPSPPFWGPFLLWAAFTASIFADCRHARLSAPHTQHASGEVLR